MMEQLKQEFSERKSLYIMLTVICTMIVMVLFNLSYLQMQFYIQFDNTSGIIKIISAQATKEEETQKWYFRAGLNYLLDDMSAQSVNFFQSNFSKFNSNDQDKILATFNNQEKFFSNNNEVFETLARMNYTTENQKYINRMSIEQFELALSDYFGPELYVNPTYVELLYNISSKYKTRLSLNNFQISMYNLFSLATNNDMAVNVLQNIDKTVLYNNLFKELEVRPVHADVFEDWMELLNKLGTLTTQEYAKFTNNYTILNQLLAQYEQLRMQENELNYMKAQMELEILPLYNELEEYHNEIMELIDSVKEAEQYLMELQDYETYEFYIGDMLPNGDYVASNPVRTFFGGYSYGDEDMRIVLTKTIPNNEGMYTITAIQDGVTEEGLPHFIELSRMQELEMVALASSIDTTNNKIAYTASKYDELYLLIQDKIDNSGLDQNQELLEALYNQMANLETRILDQKEVIEEAFGVGELEVYY
ncbi:MAG: hypothetical protein BEN18_07830 [Epulopiscium sp. Nuni2H_MBin001]|nr:MAG: hypothetical protein BEN18_07830 [Epulopiscium sp. Nuni2H_MBin001]